MLRSSCVWLVCAAACGPAPSGPTAAPGATASVPTAASSSQVEAGAGLIEAMATGSIAAPRPVSPASNSLINNQSQPVTLVVQNAVVTKPGDTSYTFEVATDSAFATRVQTKDGIAEGSGGTTSVRLDQLPAARDYYWHARATGGGTTGVFGSTSRFAIGPAIVINAPVAVGPLTGAATVASPLLTVSNATRTGPAGAITYRFEVAASASFAPVAVTGTVAEGPGGQTTFASPNLGVNRTYFWRATAVDQANAISSPPGAAQSFTTSLAIDLTKVIVAYPNAPRDIASWPETAQINVVEQDGNEAAGGPMCIGFQLFNPWPSTGFFGDPSVPVYTNQWYFANIGGQWYGGPGEYLAVRSCLTV